MGIVAVPAAVKSISCGIGKSRKWCPGSSPKPRVPPSGASNLVLVEIIPPCFEMGRVRREHWPAAACCHQRRCLSVCLSAHTGGHPQGGGSILAVLLAPRGPAEPRRVAGGSARGAQSPSVPAHKGTLVACSLPRPGCASRAPARKSFRMPSSPRQPRRVTPCVPQPHGSALRGPPRLSPPPRGSQAGRLQPAVYLRNYVCSEPVNQGFCQRCWKLLTVSFPHITPGLSLVRGHSAGGIRRGKARAGFAQGFCLSKRLMPCPRCVHALGSEGTAPCPREARAGMQTTAAAPQDAANPKSFAAAKPAALLGAERRGRTPRALYILLLLSVAQILRQVLSSRWHRARLRRGDSGGSVAKGTCPSCWPVPEERRADKLN